MIIVAIAGYVLVAAVVGGASAFALHQHFLKEFPLTTRSEIEAEDYALGAFAGLLWPVVVPFAAFVLLSRAAAQRLAKVVEQFHAMSKEAKR